MHAAQQRSAAIVLRHAALALFISVAGGCGNDGAWPARTHDPTLIERSSPSAPSVATAFEPTAIRIHPLTRRVDPNGVMPMPAASAPTGVQADLEVRVECLDRDQIETRTVGLLWLELTSNGTQWTVGPVDLSDPELNLRTFETITRTYRMSVTLLDATVPEVGGSIDIEAFLRLPSGPLLRDRFKLAWR